MRSALIGTLLSSILATTASAAELTTTFVNGITIPGDTIDVSGGNTANNGRVGFFSDIYYDRFTGFWWGLSDRGPGGGTISYDTRVQRFDIHVDPVTGAISNFSIAETVVFRDENGVAFNGLAPNPNNVLGRALDPEGIVIDKRGHFFVSDEYGPSLYEFDRTGKRVATFTTPANLIPRNGAGAANFADDVGNTAGKRTNRGFEGLAITPNRKYIYAMLQSATLDEGGGDGFCNRIVKFDVATRQPVAQYAYRMDTAGQGRGISALSATGDKQFLVLERNNRGIGVGATLNTENKLVYSIELNAAPNVSNVALNNGNCASYAPAKSLELTIGANTLADLGNKVPEKWEGLAIGPLLSDGSSLLLVGTDNDYSATQNPGGQQYDVYFRFSDSDPFRDSIQCPLDSQTSCFTTSSTLDADGYTTVTSIALPTDGSYRLMPGVLMAYKAKQ